MKIGEDQALAVARLARLQLAPGDAAAAAAQLDAILEHFSKLSELSTEGIPPTRHALAVQAELRRDEVAPAQDPAALLREAPQVAEGHFAVPRIID